ncbi:MAG: DUF2764 family protein [Victivallaceae bacterium]|nr:DUF2764 family protein [Victivallaceae bacterium]
MADFYYLMSSLPMLRLGDSPQINRDQLLASCEDKLSKQDFTILQQLALVPDMESSENSVCSAVTAWYDWETCLRNRLALRRGTSDNSADEYLRHENDFFSEIDTVIQEAVALGNPLECERHLDALRWRRLDDIESGNAFTFNALCIYMVKLLLLEKYLPRENETGYRNMDLAIAGINNAQTSHALMKTENN